MKKLKLSLVAGVLSLASLSSHASVWTSNDTWSDAWEQRYSEWINKSYNTDFFLKGPYAGIATDCANAAYYVRLIFSYENKLPFAMKDPTGGKELMSNDMTRFDSIADEGQRVRAFINYIGEYGHTSSLPSDSYPVKIDRLNVRPGTLWSRVHIEAGSFLKSIFGRGDADGAAGHVEVVKEVKDTGVLVFIASTVPKKVRELYISTRLFFLPKDSSTGLRNWIWPQNYGLPHSQQPGFSLEQYSMGGSGKSRTLSRWSDQVEAKLAQKAESRDEKIARNVNDLCTYVHARVAMVNDALVAREKSGSCISKASFDDYSTPTRDSMIADSISDLLHIIDPQHNADDSGSGESKKHHFSNPEQKAKLLTPYFQNCDTLEIAPGKNLTVVEFMQNVMEDRVSSDPNDSLQARWGIEKGHNSCPKP